jgi:hypothetical protein
MSRIISSPFFTRESIRILVRNRDKNSIDLKNSFLVLRLTGAAITSTRCLLQVFLERSQRAEARRKELPIPKRHYRPWLAPFRQQ